MARIIATGYVHEMLDKRQDFRQFALHCARAFGACILLRDDPSGPAPEKLEPSTYHRDQIDEARRTLASLQAMGGAEIEMHFAKKKADELEYLRQSIAEEADEVARCRSMLAKVQQWTAPTSEHANFKAFMEEQLSNSIPKTPCTWTHERIAKLEAATPKQMHADALATAQQDIAYHEKEWKAELERTDGRNGWLSALHNSLKSLGGGEGE